MAEQSHRSIASIDACILMISLDALEEFGEYFFGRSSSRGIAY